MIHGRAAKKEKDLPVTMRKMEIRETEERKEQAISDRERGSNKDRKSGGKYIFSNCEGKTKTDIRTKYECIQTSWKYRGLKGKTRDK